MKNGTRVQLEMGGKNPLIVLDDADLATAVSVAVNGAYFQTGQRCTASSRLIVTEGIHDRFIAAMIERMKKLVVDDALKPGTEIGPVVDEQQLGKNLEYVEIGRKEGRAARVRRRAPDARHRRLLHGAGASSPRRRRVDAHQPEEIFGPVGAVIRVKNYEEALAVANETPYGLSAGIVTTSLKHASHFKRHSQSGLVMVNLPTAGLDYHVPFGGPEEVELRSARAGRATRRSSTRSSRRRTSRRSPRVLQRGPPCDRPGSACSRSISLVSSLTDPPTAP